MGGHCRRSHPVVSRRSSGWIGSCANVKEHVIIGFDSSGVGVYSRKIDRSADDVFEERVMHMKIVLVCSSRGIKLHAVASAIRRPGRVHVCYVPTMINVNRVCSVVVAMKFTW